MRHAPSTVRVAWWAASPGLPGVAQSVAQSGQGLFDDAVVRPLAALIAGDEPGIDELLHVVRDRGLGQPDGVGQVTNARFAVVVRGDEREQAHPRWIAEGLEHAGETGGIVDV